MLESLRAFTKPPTNPDLPVALRDGCVLTRGALAQRQQYWAQIIAEIAEPAVALHQHCGFEQVALLLAIWQHNKVAVLPAGTHRSHLQTILAEEQLASLDDETNEFALGVQSEKHSDDTALIIYTSGSSGNAKPIPKQFAQLDAELQLLEQRWGSDIAGTLFVSTVSRHHMYGLPFALLWPLVRGSVFLSRSITYLESLENIGDQAFTLITSPVQLANLPPQLDWAVIGKQCAQIFCAGAPLAPAAANHAQQCFAKAVTEIYGSTESGVVAYRHQHRSMQWQCFEGVNIRLDTTQQLQVSSTVAGTTDAWLTLSDLAELHDTSRFTLAGRSDQIVKIGGKRLSLTQTTRQLAAHPWVDEAHCLVVTERRGRIGAAVSLSAEGRRQLIDRGRLFVNRELTRFLSDKLDPLARPRLWRYLKSLPRNTQGKLVNDALLALFLPDQQPRLPEVVNRQHSEDALSGEWELFIPHQLHYFDGHFPGNAILPGVVQVSWAIHFAQSLIDSKLCFQRLEAVKFQHVVQAGDTITLSLSWQPEAQKLRFAYRGREASGQEKPHSSGRIGFRHGD